MPSSELQAATLEEIYEDGPCGYLTLKPDGEILTVNRTFQRAIGESADALTGRRLQDLLAPGARIYHDIHWQQVILLRGSVRELPSELVRPDGTRVSVLLNGDVKHDSDGETTSILVSVFDATDRRRYEQDLMAARDEERGLRLRVERLQRVSAAIGAPTNPKDVARALVEELVMLTFACAGKVILAGGAEIAMDEPGDGETIVVELASGGRSAGFLELSFTVRRPPTDDDRNLISDAILPAAQALLRAQLYMEVRDRSAQQAVLTSVGEQVLGGAPLPVLLERARTAVETTLLAERVELEEDPRRTLSPLRSGALDIHIGNANQRWGRMAVYPAGDGPFAPKDHAFCEAIAFLIWNVIERNRHEDETHYRATHDHLTGLPNRLQTEDRLSHEIARAARTGKPFALYLLDLDDFKLINDNLGHAVGDDLLCAVANRLNGRMREIDMIARLSGDEFAIICADLGPDEDELLARRILESLAAPFALGEASHVLRVTMGSATGDGDATAEALLRQADVAMHRAKETFRGQHMRFNPAMLERGRQQLEVGAALRIALEQRELCVYYQPKVRATDGELTGMEALVRWRRSDGTIVPPDAFIGVAERTGLIVDIGAFVLEEACRALVHWRAEELIRDDVGIAVNVSGLQLLDPGFVSTVQWVLQHTGMDKTPHLLGLEVTESVVTQLGESAVGVLDELAAMGVGLHLDDFGMGASSLARLRRFPVDTLKIDRAFVSGLGEEAGEDGAIVAAIVGMARALGLAVVAEGVETDPQLARLREVGADTIQGFLFSRPVPEHQAPEVFARLNGRPESA